MIESTSTISLLPREEIAVFLADMFPPCGMLGFAHREGETKIPMGDCADYVQHLDATCNAAKLLAERMVKQHGHGTFSAYSYPMLSKEGTVLRLYLHLFGDAKSQ